MLLCGVLLAWWMEHRKYAPFMETHARYQKWIEEARSGQSGRYETDLKTLDDWQAFCFTLQDDVRSLEWSNKELKKPHKADGFVTSKEFDDLVKQVADLETKLKVFAEMAVRASSDQREVLDLLRAMMTQSVEEPK